MFESVPMRAVLLAINFSSFIHSTYKHFIPISTTVNYAIFLKTTVRLRLTPKRRGMARYLPQSVCMMTVEVFEKVFEKAMLRGFEEN